MGLISKRAKFLSKAEQEPCEPGDLILIVVEGTATEPSYFRELAETLGSRTQVSITRAQGTDPLSIVNHALASRNASLSKGVPYDRVWCVFDHEAVGKNAKLPDGVTKAVDNNIELAVSNPCFEVWYLLHFGVAGPQNDCGSVVKSLKKHMPKYKKGGCDISILKPRTAQATRFARRLRMDQEKTTTNRWPNPSTDVDLLVACLVSMAREGKEELGY